MRIFIILIVMLCNVAYAQQNVSSGRLDILRDVAEVGFLRATTVKPFTFPKDHGAHPGYRHEWWYSTGNLEGPEGRRFGYELTFFRLALAPEDKKQIEENKSGWKTPVAFAAHFAVTDVEEEDFHFFDRYSRADGRLAGTKGTRVWLEDWSLEQSEDGWVIKASEGDIKLNLDLKQVKPPVLNGDQGLSRKSEAIGNATYYYTLPRLQSTGSIEISGETFSVEGLTWLDREWGTSALSSDQQGWDWYALHLSDGSDLMFYNLRNMDNSRHSYSAGSLISPTGEKTSLKAEDVIIEVTDYWESPLGGRYPSQWRLSIPNHGINLNIKPVINNQELNTIPRYWEGAVDVIGQRGEDIIEGQGYVELTGYSR
ncbi:MAG: carotenoid 1,2-hydratase [Kordiimonadaceae bacterium]|jgi:predicted secreted hydrolase|nr:carotenoid 1,2-hydratase [Kordiimonadaceae bacterium]MBT6031251.1 carotenoid 1,2-hydratase [Kordiimonadaceae bacterium]